MTRPEGESQSTDLGASSRPANPVEFTRLPRGSMAWQEFTAALATLDDFAERHYLEMKSELEPLTGSGRAKIAKFILGAANRDPDTAHRQLDGFAIMVLGIRKGAVDGISRIENHELRRVVQPFLGVDGPKWDAERVPAGHDKDVLVIVVDPPESARRPFLCRQAGDKVEDGAIYLRADGETRLALSGEVDRMLSARPTGPVADLGVSVIGPVRSYSFDEDRWREAVDGVADALTSAGAVEAPASGYALGSAFDAAAYQNAFESRWAPETRTRKGFETEVEVWRRACLPNDRSIATAALAQHVDSVVVRVENRSELAYEALRMQIHVAGAVVAREELHPTDVIPWLPVRPRRWGAFRNDRRQRQEYSFAKAQPLDPYTAPGSGLRHPYSFACELELDELRPLAVRKWRTGLVLEVEDPQLTDLNASWTATARRMHAQFRGDFTLPVAQPFDLTEMMLERLSKAHG